MLATAFTLAALAPVLAGAGSCASADARAASVGADVHARAVRCLVNAERERRGLARLRPNRALTAAAGRHARDMVRRGFFDHRSPDGSTPATRARRAGYPSPSVAETIAWGTGFLGTPAATVKAWMASAPHRRILVDRRVRDIGVGVALGTPRTTAAGGATVTADVGLRQPARGATARPRAAPPR